VRVSPGTALRVPSLPIHLLEDPCWGQGCISFGPGAGCPCGSPLPSPCYRAAHCAGGSFSPQPALSAEENTAKATELWQIWRPLVRPGDPARAWQQVTHAGSCWNWHCRVALKIQQLVRLTRSPVGLYRQLACVNVCPAGSYSMISMLMYDP